MTDLEAQLRPSVAAVKSALADLMFAPGRQAVADFLAYAPVDPCVHLAECWSSAQAAGVPTEQVLLRFSPEEQFLIELVASVYAMARSSPTGRTDLHELGQLLDETALTPALADTTSELPILRPR